MSADIQHVVVLMLENRSFDCMLGRLYPQDSDFRGLTLDESNFYGMNYLVWSDPQMTAAAACTPDPDPGEAFTDMNVQLFGDPDRAGKTATMSGFALNYGSQPASAGDRDPGAVMHYFTPDQVPIISALATAFGVCDRWHASAPCQTWPNRFFAHTGTALGYVDNNTFKIPFEAPSLLRRLEDCGKAWRVYFHDTAQSMLIRDIWVYAPLHFRLFGEFLADAHSGALPAYSFIEPRYFTDLVSSLIPNDEHPPHNVLYGEQLIAGIYNALRSSPCWKQTLFIITYDEHGGCYDHVVPPPAAAPDGIVNNPYNFNFDSYGVRVPAVVVSPWIPPGSKIRPQQGSPAPFDHTSIIKTVREIFALGAKLTDRDEAAPSLVPALSLAGPTNDGPQSLTAATAPPEPTLLVARSAAAPNGMQASLAAAAASLPASAPATEHDLPQPVQPVHGRYSTVATAQAAAAAGTKAFLGL